MSDVTVKITLTIDKGSVGSETFEITKTTGTGGDNPIYWGDYCAAAMQDVATRIEASIVARHGDIRAARLVAAGGETETTKGNSNGD